jgi:mono/diheme cytochrome c family protein
MSISRVVSAAACAALLSGAVLGASPAVAGAQMGAAPAARGGAYLVGPAGQCSDCHGATLGGGPNPIPGPPGAPWAKTIPSLHGLKMFKSDAAAIAFLHTAVLPTGKHALGPMPRYNFSVADATAIVVYLRSLK